MGTKRAGRMYVKMNTKKEKEEEADNFNAQRAHQKGYIQQLVMCQIRSKKGKGRRGRQFRGTEATLERDTKTVNVRQVANVEKVQLREKFAGVISCSHSRAHTHAPSPRPQ